MILNTTVSCEGDIYPPYNNCSPKPKEKKSEERLTATEVKEKSLIDLSGQEDSETDSCSFHVLKD